MTAKLAIAIGNAPSEIDRFRELFRYSSEADYFISAQGVILLANPKSEEVTNYEIAELEGMKFRDLFTPEDQGAMDTLITSTLQWQSGIDPFRHLRRKNGRKLIVEIRTSILEIGAERIIICAMTDISARVRAEEAAKRYLNELETLNAELEDRVKARTRELATAHEELLKSHELITAQKREIDDIMATIRQAIFTIGPDGKINPQHSAFVREVFGQKEVAGVDVVDFLFEGCAKDSQPAATLRKWAKVVFDRSELWEDMKALAPRELIFQKPAAGGAMDMRELTFDWFPVFAGETLVKIMVICHDMTEENRLRRQIEINEKEHNDELELLSHLIAQPPGAVETFAGGMSGLVAEAAKLLDRGSGSSPIELDRLMRVMHTIKGTSAQLGVRGIEEVAQEIESLIAQKQESPPSAERLVEIFQKIKRHFDKIQLFLERTRSSQGDEGAARAASICRMEDRLRGVGNFLQLRGTEAIPPQMALLLASSLGYTRIASLFDRLEAVANSLRKDSPCPLLIERRGDDVEIDPRMVNLFYEVLLHAVRNCVSHGAQDARTRTEAGKPEALRIGFAAWISRDAELVVEVSDDGQGIDVAKMRDRLVLNGRHSMAELLSMRDDEVCQRIFDPGFTMRDEADELAGRGVGLAIVKEAIEGELAGKASVSSEQGQGTRISLRVPLDACFAQGRPVYEYSFRNPKNEIRWKVALNLPKQLGGSGRDKDSPTILLADSFEAAAVRPDRSICIGRFNAHEAVEMGMSGVGLRHFVHEDLPQSASYLDVIGRGIAMPEKFKGIESFLCPGTPVRERMIRAYADKAALLDELSEFVASLGVFSGCPQIAALIADELIMNALFNAPVDAKGNRKYQDLPRNHPLVLGEEEVSLLRYSVDDAFIAISVRDPFGSLSHEGLVAYLVKSYARNHDQIDTKPRGAGLGLYTLFDSSNSTIFNVQPGKMTEVICLIRRSPSHLKYQQAGRSFSFFGGR